MFLLLNSYYLQAHTLHKGSTELGPAFFCKQEINNQMAVKILV